MTSDSTGEIRCPSCGRQTPLAPFCTHCGAVIPEGASAPRPRAMDREELEERARIAREGGVAFRRGQGGEPEPGPGGWTAPHAPPAFVPEPSDAIARTPEGPEGGETQRRVDNFDESRVAESAPPYTPPDVPPVAPAPAYVPPARAAAPDPVPSPPPRGSVAPGFPAGAPAVTPGPPPVPSRPYQPPSAGGYGGGGYDPGAYARDAYDAGRGGGYDGPGEGQDAGWPPEDGGPPPRRSSALPIIGLLVLGIAALLGGALLFIALNATGGVAQGSPTPTPSASATESTSPSTSPSESATAAPSGGASASTGASAVADNFTARAQPCATSKMSFQGCDQDGSQLTGSQVWVWVGFKGAQASDLLGVTIVDKSNGSAVGDGSVSLTQIGCDASKPCAGYIQMTFGSLDPADYTINVTRNGDQVATAAFSVSS